MYLSLATNTGVTLETTMSKVKRMKNFAQK